MFFSLVAATENISAKGKIALKNCPGKKKMHFFFIKIIWWHFHHCRCLLHIFSLTEEK